MKEKPDPEIDFLRHTLATLAYRAEKVLRNAPPDFGALRFAAETRTAAQILAHMCDLMDWALWLAKGKHVWRDSSPGEWEADVDRFFAALVALDAFFVSGVASGAPPARLFQGPIADALTHVGQIAVMRRVAGAPVRGENYFRAEIVPGRAGADQSARRVEFD